MRSEAMSRSLCILITISLASVAASALPVHGQGVGGVPTPGGPRLSPWLNLYQRQGGPVDNYHMYVQPAQELRNTLQMQQMGIQHNATGVSAVGEQLVSASESYYAPASPTGNGAGFMNYGRYFSNTSSGAPGAGVFGMPGTGGFARPGGVGAFGTPGLGGANAGGGYANPAAYSRPSPGGMGAGY
jgi:hypothetical protein